MGHFVSFFLYIYIYTFIEDMILGRDYKTFFQKLYTFFYPRTLFVNFIAIVHFERTFNKIKKKGILGYLVISHLLPFFGLLVYSYTLLNILACKAERRTSAEFNKTADRLTLQIKPQIVPAL